MFWSAPGSDGIQVGPDMSSTEDSEHESELSQEVLLFPLYPGFWPLPPMFKLDLKLLRMPSQRTRLDCHLMYDIAFAQGLASIFLAESAWFELKPLAPSAHVKFTAHEPKRMGAIRWRVQPQGGTGGRGRGTEHITTTWDSHCADPSCGC